MTLVNLAFAGHLSAIGLVGGVWALVDATANTKYVCTDTSDTYVTSARWLDVGQFATAFATSCLVLYRQVKENTETPKPPKPASPQFSVLVEVCAGLGILIYLTLVITTASVCGNNKCITSAAAAAYGSDPTTYNAQVRAMVGGVAGAKAPCGGALAPSWFNTPQNYCLEQLARQCDNSDSSSVIIAERCSVYACSNQVPGAIARSTISVICLVMQILAAAILAVYVQRKLPREHPMAVQVPAAPPVPTAPPKPLPVQGKGILEPGPALGLPTQLRKRNRLGKVYTSVPNDLHF